MFLSRIAPAALRAIGRSICALAISLSLVVGGVGSGWAQNVPTVRDAEIEALVRDYAKPLLAAAGLSRKNIEIVLVNDPRFNAFVSGRRIFMNTGTLMTAETPNEVIGVLAHEIGHLAGGHQERLRLQVDRAKTLAMVGMLLGMGTLAAGAATKSSELGGVGMGMATGSGEAARRSLLAYQRSEETAADRSALTYLEATHQSARGMLKTFKRFQSALALSGTRIDPYQISHPTPRDRIANLEVLARKSPYFETRDDPELQRRHDRMRAKIAAFTNGRGSTAQLFRQNNDVEAKQYGEAIEGYLHGNPRAALAKVDALIKADPNNPYHYELRGDTLMKANKPAEAADAYGRAIKLDPARSSVLQVSYGQALLAQGRTSISARDCGGSGKYDRLSLSGTSVRATRAGRASRTGGRRRPLLQRQFSGCQDLRRTRPEEAQTRFTGMAARAGHHQLSQTARIARQHG